MCICRVSQFIIYYYYYSLKSLSQSLFIFNSKFKSKRLSWVFNPVILTTSLGLSSYAAEQLANFLSSFISRRLPVKRSLLHVVSKLHYKRIRRIKIRKFDTVCSLKNSHHQCITGYIESCRWEINFLQREDVSRGSPAGNI